jgi:hypothetical protein
MQYCCELKIVLEQDAQAMQRSFRDLLTTLVETQQRRVDQGNPCIEDRTDYLAQIRTLYKNGQFRLAASASCFDVKLDDGFVHSGELCLRKNRLCQFFPDVNFDNIKDSLLRQGALRRGVYRDEIQIGATKGKRFYAIPLRKLQ